MPVQHVGCNCRCDPVASVRWQIGEMLFDTTNVMFIEFVKQVLMAIAQLRSAIRRQSRTLIEAIIVAPSERVERQT